MNSLINIKNISKDFVSGDKLVQALKNIEISINSGELTMITGPSGCGKTTLLSIMSGILTPTTGEVIIEGQNITKLSDNKKIEFRRRNLGFIFQQFNLLTNLTAIENISIPLIADGVNQKIARLKAIEILEQIGMNEQIDKLPSEMSGGQQQRVSIARALIHEPKVIICDEPTSALDAKTGRNVMEVLKQNSLNENRAVIIVTHDYRIFEFANRIIEMDDGKIISDKSC